MNNSVRQPDPSLDAMLEAEQAWFRAHPADGGNPRERVAAMRDALLATLRIQEGDPVLMQELAVPGMRFGAGVRLSVFVEAARRWKKLADVAVVSQMPKHDDAAFVAFASKGGHARAESLTPERRAEIARQAANTRWNKEV